MDTTFGNCQLPLNKKRKHVELEPDSNVTCKRQRVEIQSSNVNYPVSNAKLPNVTSHKSLKHLPAEMLVKILSNVSTRDLLQNVALVSKHFNKLTKCPEVHLKVSISEKSQLEGAILFTKRSKFMTELNFIRRDTGGYKNSTHDCFVHKVLLAARSHGNLRSVLCRNLWGSCKYSTLVLLSKSTWWRKLQKFEVRLAQMPKKLKDKEKFDDAMSNLGSDGNLSHFLFKMEDESNEFVQSIHLLITSTRSNKLKSLEIYMKYKDDQLAEIFAARKDSLESLAISDLACARLGRKSAETLIQCQQLKHFITSTAFDSFHIFPKLQNLTTLIIGDLYEEFQYTDCLPQNSMPNMTKIRIHSAAAGYSYMGILDKDMFCRRRNIIFVALAKACPNLKSYRIRITSYKERLSQEFFLEIVKNCAKLEEFDYNISGEKIKLDDSTAQFMLKNMMSLKLLNLKVLIIIIIKH